MYKIISEGRVVHCCDEPVYITLDSPNGCPQQTDAEHADCVSVRGALYRLPTAKNVDESLPSAILRSDFDGGAEMFELDRRARDTDERLAYTNAETEAAVCDLDRMYSDRIAELEVTICEMDMAAAAGGQGGA